MSSFMANLFASSQSGKAPSTPDSLPAAPPPLHTRTSHNDAYTERPSTPPTNRASFITPTQTPQGSPSKNRNPPGAIDLPSAFDAAMRLAPAALDSPTKLSASTRPLSPGKSNALAPTVDDSYFAQGSSVGDESVLHKPVTGGSGAPGSPTRKQGKENTSPGGRLGEFSAGQTLTQNPAALSRQEVYQSRDQASPTIRKYNTQRGLTAEELEILQKPNVKRLANVTQLCEF